MSNLVAVLFVVNFILNNLVIYMLLKHTFNDVKKLSKLKVQKTILLIYIKNNILGGDKMSLEEVENKVNEK